MPNTVNDRISLKERMVYIEETGVHIRPTTSEVNKDNSKDNKGEAEVQARPQRARQKPHWTKDYTVC